MPVAAIADQTVRYRFNGSVPDAAGTKIPVVLFVVVTRYGRQEVTTSLGIGGALTSAQRTSLPRPRCDCAGWRP